MGIVGHLTAYRRASSARLAGDRQDRGAQCPGDDINPGDERYSRNVDLYLYHQASSEPVEEATVQATASMRFMDHGTFQQAALNLGGGHYLVLLPFPMTGEWQLKFDIAAPDPSGAIWLDIDLFE